MNERETKREGIFLRKIEVEGGKGQYMRSCNKYETPEKAEAIIAASMSPRLPYLTVPTLLMPMTGASHY